MSGGIGPYIYYLNNAIVFTGNSTQYSMTGLAPGIYNVKVSGGAGSVVSNVLNVQVGGTYQEPTLSCAIQGCDVVATVQNGLAPFSYQLATSSPNGPFSPPQSSNVFVAPSPSGVYYVRVTDSCGNIYTKVFNTNLTDISSTIACSAISGATPPAYQVNITATSGGFPPYTYDIIPSSGTFTALGSNSFTDLTACNYQIKVTDACGHEEYFDKTTCIVPSVAATCINCQQKTAKFVASGGTAPYTYTLTHANGSLANTTGNFTNVYPLGSTYICSVTDACGATSTTQYGYCDGAIVTCKNTPFDGQVDFSLSAQYFSQATLPIQVSCNSCPPPNVVTINSASQLPYTFTGLMSGTQHFTMLDNCGQPITLKSTCVLEHKAQMIWVTSSTSGPPCTGSGCNSGDTAVICGNTLEITCPLPGVSYEVYNAQTGQFYAANNTGLFPAIPPGIYHYKIFTASGFLILAGNINTAIYFTNLDVSCKNLYAGACPPGLSFQLLSMNGAVLYTNTTGFFPNLNPGTGYVVKAFNPQTGQMVKDTIVMESAGILDYDLSGCDYVNAKLIFPTPTNETSVVDYRLMGQNTGYDVTNQTGIFSPLGFDDYTLTATRGNCNTVYQYFTIGGTYTPSFCLLPGNNFIQSWQLLFGAATINQIYDAQTHALVGTIIPGQILTQSFPPGSYYLQNPDCKRYNVTLPPVPTNPLNVVVSSVCQNLACIKATGAMGTAEWQSWSQGTGFTYCGPSDVYVLMGSGTTVSNNTGEFCDLNVGGVYTIMLRRGAVTIAQQTLTIPTYVPPNLQAFDAYSCPNNPFGTVMLVANGTGMPYTYEILNAPPGYSPTSFTTYNDTVYFAQLPNGNYDFMVYDYCGASSDYSASVADYNLILDQDVSCKGEATLSATHIWDATYAWTDASGNLLGNTHVLQTQVSQLGGIYQLELNFNGCQFVKQISIQNAYNAILSANAGSDQIGLFYNGQGQATLQGQPTPMASTYEWTDLNPSLPPTAILNPQNLQTDIVVGALDTYYYQLKVTVDVSCVLYDTVMVNFTDCGNSAELKASVEIKNNECMGMEQGQARAVVESGIGPYSFLWSNGKESEMVTKLAVGTYWLQVTDSAGCIPGEVVAKVPFEVGFDAYSPNVSIRDNWANNTLWLDQLIPLSLSFDQDPLITAWEWDLGALGSSQALQPTLNFTEAGVYPIGLTVYNGNCKSQTQASFEVLDKGLIFMPNAFTPDNGDDENDLFGPVGTNIMQQSFVIYDRWGREVFRSEQVGEMWDGTYGGQMCQEGTYTYTLDARIKGGQNLKRSGTVVLMR